MLAFRVLNRASGPGGLASARPLPTGGSMKIELNGVCSTRLPEVLDATTPDHRMLATCLNRVDEGLHPVLVTNDARARIKGALGVDMEGYRGDTVPIVESYGGVAEIDVAPEVVDELFGSGKVTIGGSALLVNQFVVLRGRGSQSELGRVAASDGDVVVTRVSGSRHAFGSSRGTPARRSPSISSWTPTLLR